MPILEQRAPMAPQRFTGDLNPVLKQGPTGIVGGWGRPQHISKARLIFNELTDCMESCADRLGMVGMGMEMLIRRGP